MFCRSMFQQRTMCDDTHSSGDAVQLQLQWLFHRSNVWNWYVSWLLICSCADDCSVEKIKRGSREALCAISVYLKVINVAAKRRFFFKGNLTNTGFQPTFLFKRAAPRRETGIWYSKIDTEHIMRQLCLNRLVEIIANRWCTWLNDMYIAWKACVSAS